MMQVWILEDEAPAYRRLIAMAQEMQPTWTFSPQLPSIEAATAYLGTTNKPDLILSDIELADGSSFDFFRAHPVLAPVIFTTAYNQYAIDAFKVNGIDYLLKPIKQQELQYALDRFIQLRQPMQNVWWDKLTAILQPASLVGSTSYKTRFVVKYGDYIRTIPVDEVAYFYTEDRATFLQTKEGRRFAVDANLETLEGQLNPQYFFRINRQFIICIDAIAEMTSYSKSRVMIQLNPPSRHETIVSVERSADFKTWLGGGS